MTEPYQPDTEPKPMPHPSSAHPPPFDRSPSVESSATEETETSHSRAAADELAQAQAELSALKAKSGELADQYLRAKAETENARRRADEEVAKARKFALEAFSESLLPVLDSLEAALAIKDSTVQQMQEGSEATLRQLMAALERNKIIAIEPKAGDKFDPNLHHAISIVSPTMDSQQVPNTIVNVLQKGYTIAERVLRPALVTVTAPS